MANLAIKGHATRGREIIELLEMLGGKNSRNYSVDCDNLCFYISKDTNIIYYDWVNHCYEDECTFVFTLEEFLEKFPYKVGDKVKNVKINDFIGRITNARWDINEEQIIYTVEWDDATKSTLTYFAKGLQPYKEETMEEKLVCNEIMSLPIDISKMEKRKIIFSVDTPNETELVLGDNFEIKVEDGKTYVVRKKPQYPRNYEECCHMLGVLMQNSLEYINKDCNKDYYYNDLKSTLNTFVSLKICRDAYWKIAGEQMRLDKPWEPEFRYGKKKYCIMTKDNKVISATVEETNRILVFPTEEMRDTFYENFKDLIEQCKEFL